MPPSPEVIPDGFVRVSSVIFDTLASSYQIVQSLPLIDLHLSDDGAYVGGGEFEIEGSLEVNGVLLEFGRPSYIEEAAHTTDLVDLGSQNLAVVAILNTAFDEITWSANILALDEDSEHYELQLNVSNVN